MGFGKMFTAFRWNLREVPYLGPWVFDNSFLSPTAEQREGSARSTQRWGRNRGGLADGPSSKYAGGKNKRIWSSQDVTDSDTDQGLLWVDGVGGFLVLLQDELPGALA